MFLLWRPSPRRIERFLLESRDLPVSYHPVGLVKDADPHAGFDEAAVVVGHGVAAFERARAALLAWRQFDIGWVEAFPPNAPVAVGTDVAVLIRHLGFWSLNGARVLYIVGGDADASRFGYAYGTLTNHAESGEELFEVSLDPRTGDVTYLIRATSWPQAVVARAGQPIVRMLQQRFRDHSAAAMVRATCAGV